MDDEGNEGDLSDPDSATTQAEPVDEDFDGTFNPSKSALYTADFDLIEAFETLSIWWSGWWPLLHVAYSIPISYGIVDITLNFHIAKNLLGFTEDQDVSMSGDGSFWEGAPAIIAFLIENALPLAGILTAIAILGNAVEVAYKSAAALAPLALAAGIVALAVVAAYAWWVPVTFAEERVESGAFTHFDAFIFLLECSLVYFMAAWGMNKSQMKNTFPDYGPIEIVDNVAVKGFLDWMKPTMVAFLVVAAIGAAILSIGVVHLLMSF